MDVDRRTFMTEFTGFSPSKLPYTRQRVFFKRQHLKEFSRALQGFGVATEKVTGRFFLFFFQTSLESPPPSPSPLEINQSTNPKKPKQARLIYLFYSTPAPSPPPPLSDISHLNHKTHPFSNETQSRHTTPTPSTTKKLRFGVPPTISRETM